MRASISLILAFVFTGPSAADPAQVTAGRVLVLEGERLIEGDIRLVEGRYLVRRNGGETVLPPEGVLFLCDSKLEAYHGLLGRLPSNDPTHRLRLARWCIAHNLREQALAEAKAAVEIDPSHPEAGRMVSWLSQSLADPRIEPAPAAPISDALIPVAEPARFNGSAYPDFATKVQPILMNTCVTCHGADDRNGFTLWRMLPGDRSRRETHHNLAVVLKFVDHSDPSASLLLKNAVAAHGGIDRAPIHDRGHVAFQTLERWVRLAVLPEGAGPEQAEDSTPGPIPVNAIPVGFPAGVARPAGSSTDPFDPAEFNAATRGSASPPD